MSGEAQRRPASGPGGGADHARRQSTASSASSQSRRQSVASSTGAGTAAAAATAGQSRRHSVASSTGADSTRRQSTASSVVAAGPAAAAASLGPPLSAIQRGQVQKPGPSTSIGEEGKFLKAPPESGIHESVQRRGSDSSEDIGPNMESRAARINRMRLSVDTTARGSKSSPIPSTFDMPPLGGSLELTTRYSSLSDDPSTSISSDVKSALKQGDKGPRKQGIRFDESTTFISDSKTIGIVTEKPAIVWLVGPPSSGKRTLTAYIQQELAKRQTQCNVVDWSNLIPKGQRASLKGMLPDTADTTVVNVLLAAMIDKKKTPTDVLIMVNFPQNINQAQLFEKQFRPPDLVVSLTASQKVLVARWTDVNRKALASQFAGRSDRYYRETDPMLQRYKGLVITLDAEQSVSEMWERLRQVMVGMRMMQGQASITGL